MDLSGVDWTRRCKSSQWRLHLDLWGCQAQNSKNGNYDKTHGPDTKNLANTHTTGLWEQNGLFHLAKPLPVGISLYPGQHLVCLLVLIYASIFHFLGLASHTKGLEPFHLK